MFPIDNPSGRRGSWEMEIMEELMNPCDLIVAPSGKLESNCDPAVVAFFVVHL